MLAFWICLGWICLVVVLVVFLDVLLSLLFGIVWISRGSVCLLLLAAGFGLVACLLIVLLVYSVVLVVWI